MKYWINVVSKDHVQRGTVGGFTQANHGKPHMLKRLNKSDWIVFYSPKTSYENGETLQAFTALAQVIDDDIYEVEVSPTFRPWRRNVRFSELQETPIRPLIEDLSFIKDKTHWGYAFRFGMFEIIKEDFDRITKNKLSKE